MLNKGRPHREIKTRQDFEIKKNMQMKFKYLVLAIILKNQIIQLKQYSNNLKKLNYLNKNTLIQNLYANIYY